MRGWSAFIRAVNRNEIGVHARRDRHPQNLVKKLSRRDFKT
jgi:hypothetical protein